MMQRVFYEVSALLPAMAKIIIEHEGAVTEYLGDGLLALFQLPKQPKDQSSVLYNVMTAAETCLASLHQVVNPILNKRYRACYRSRNRLGL
jgi:class 3 adenylate cyclase